MSEEEPTKFSNLYKYVTEKGVVFPETGSIAEDVTDTFKEVFGQSLDTSAETPVGRLIEAITLLFTTVVGINAQNERQFNLNYATGPYLDALGAMFGVTRSEGMSDARYRKAIKGSRHFAIGFPASVSNAVYGCTNAWLTIDSVVVHNNGNPYPICKNGITIPGHSIYVCVDYVFDASYTDEQEVYEKINSAIDNSVSAGCGFFSSDAGNFVKATPVVVDVNVKIGSIDSYVGLDYKAEVEETVKNYIESHGIGGKIGTLPIASEIKAVIPSIEVEDVKLTISDIEYDTYSFSDAQVPKCGTVTIVEDGDEET